jgi:hypothetical protein
MRGHHCPCCAGGTHRCLMQRIDAHYCQVGGICARDAATDAIPCELTLWNSLSAHSTT